MLRRGCPDPAVPALCWWLSTTYLCLRHAFTAGTGGRRWLAAPILTALLAVVARPLAVAVAPAAFLLAVVAVAATTLRDARRAGAKLLPALRPLFERATLLAILCLALALRWTPRMADPFVSDAGGCAITATSTPASGSRDKSHRPSLPEHPPRLPGAPLHPAPAGRLRPHRRRPPAPSAT